ncbi:MAG: hypothetical protein KKB25_02475 [Nanoarchaeota archaeon]|nr:hypothetical protein [Nanoarchaeota archaeon]
MKLESVEIVKAEDLPFRVRQENKIFSGLVEVRFERNSPLMPVLRKLDGTFSQKLREVMKREKTTDSIF